MRSFLRQVSHHSGSVDQVIHVLDTFESLREQNVSYQELAAVAGSLVMLGAGISDDSGAPLAEWIPQDHYRPARSDLADLTPLRMTLGPRDRPYGSVWLLGGYREDPLHALVLERLGHAAEIRFLRERGESSTRPDGKGGQNEQLRILLSPGAEGLQRLDAARRLGMAVGEQAAVAVCSDTESGLVRYGQLKGRAISLKDGLVHIVVPESDAKSMALIHDSNTQVGIGRWYPAERLQNSAKCASKAFQFTAPHGLGRPHYGADGLGGLLYLSDLPSEELLAIPDVEAVFELADASNGMETLLILEEAMWERSLRAVAIKMNFHHSTIAAKMARAERFLKLSLSEPTGRLRAQTGLLGWRLVANRRRQDA